MAETKEQNFEASMKRLGEIVEKHQAPAEEEPGEAGEDE